ncbi:MAG: tetratricopeptide repeat protein, partial [Deferrisomatales bacterium]
AVHAGAGSLLVPVLLWHLYFAQLHPAALSWRAPWLGGRVAWDQAEHRWPAWTRRWAESLGPGPEAEPAAPSVEALLEAGNRAARTGRFADAEAAYQEALRVYPGYSQALYNLGAARLRAGDPAGAREALERFLGQDPFSPVAARARELLAGLPKGGADGR